MSTQTVEVPHIHPPKIEVFDLAAMTNIDPKGFPRPVDRYQVESFGLYMARSVVGHPGLTYFESWLLPDLGLRITNQRWRPGHERDYDFYLDIVRITRGLAEWRTEDHYLDILVRTGHGLEVLDTDELFAAVAHGLLDSGAAQHALEITYRTVERIASHGYDLARWMDAEGIDLKWQRR